jgi:hypothetical protein
MIRRTTWIILAIFVILLGVVWAFPSIKGKLSASTKATATPETRFLVNLDEKNIQSLHAEDPAGKVVGLGRDANGVWTLLEPPGKQIDLAAAESGVTQLLSLPITLTLEPAFDPASIGLNPAAYTITLDLMDGKKMVIKVGKLTPIKNGYYTQLDDGPVTVVNNYSLDAFLNMLDHPPVLETPTPTVSATATLTDNLTTTPAIPPSPSSTVTPAATNQP